MTASERPAAAIRVAVSMAAALLPSGPCLADGGAAPSAFTALSATQRGEDAPSTSIASSSPPGAEAASATASNTPPVAPDTQWPETYSVNELMQAELRAVLAARRRGSRNAVQAVAGEAPRNGEADEPVADRVDLAAIYGVGKRLHVEVVVNGVIRQYAHGRKWPDGGNEVRGAYALVAINGRCVKLDGAGGARTVCLHDKAEGLR